MRTYSGVNETVWAVARLSAERSQIAALADRSLVVWDDGAADPVQVLPVPKPVRTHSGLSVSPCGSWLAGYSEGQRLVWHWSGQRWESHSEEDVPGLCVCRFGTEAATLTTVRVVNGKHHPVEFLVSRRSLNARRSPREVGSTFDAHPSGLRAAEDLYRGHWWAADLSTAGGWLLLSAWHKAIHVWQVATGKHVGSVKLRGVPNEAPFSPDGSLFAVDGGTTVYVHRTRTQELVAAWKVKHCYVPQLAWSPDGGWLARADLTSDVRLFGIASHQETAPLGVRGQRGKSVAFSPDGSTYLVGTVKGTVLVWDID
jgi:WD40 repeat protein